MMGSVNSVGGNLKANGAVIPIRFQGELIPKRLYDSGHIDMEHIENIFADLANSLTRYLRTHGNGTYSSPAVGEAQYCIVLASKFDGFGSRFRLFSQY